MSDTRQPAALSFISAAKKRQIYRVARKFRVIVEKCFAVEEAPSLHPIAGSPRSEPGLTTDMDYEARRRMVLEVASDLDAAWHGEVPDNVTFGELRAAWSVGEREGNELLSVVFEELMRQWGWLEDPRKFAGFDLRLMSWGDSSGVPTSGNNLVIVGIDNNSLLHIRIYDAAGNRITDKDETKLPVAQAAAIATLKQQLPGLLPPHVLTDAEKAHVIGEGTSIVGQTPYALQLPPPPDRRGGSVPDRIVGDLNKSLEIKVTRRQLDSLDRALELLECGEQSEASPSGLEEKGDVSRKQKRDRVEVIDGPNEEYLVRLDDKNYNVSAEGAALVRVLLEADRDYISAPKMCQKSTLLEPRPDRIMKKLPSQVRGIIETENKSGSRIKREWLE